MLQIEKGIGEVVIVVFSDDENGVKVDGLPRLQNHRDRSLALLKQREDDAAKQQKALKDRMGAIQEEKYRIEAETEKNKEEILLTEAAVRDWVPRARNAFDQLVQMLTTLSSIYKYGNWRNPRINDLRHERSVKHYCKMALNALHPSNQHRTLPRYQKKLAEELYVAFTTCKEAYEDDRRKLRR